MSTKTSTIYILQLLTLYFIYLKPMYQSTYFLIPFISGLQISVHFTPKHFSMSIISKRLIFVYVLK